MFLIVDEAQNLTPHEVKTIITRAGEGTKIVFCGDIWQIDHPYLDSRINGLSYLVSRMKGQSIYAHITLEKGERRRWPIWRAIFCDLRTHHAPPRPHDRALHYCVEGRLLFEFRGRRWSSSMISDGRP